MAIAKMNSFTLLTFRAHRQALLKRLQVYGDVHLKTLDQKEQEELEFLRPDFSQKQLSEYETELEKVRFTVARLAPHAEKPGLTAKRKSLSFSEFDRYADDYDYGAVYEQVKQQDEAIASARAQAARHQAENDGLRAWVRLDVSPADLEGLESAGYLLGTVNKQAAEEFTAKVGERYADAYMELLDTVKEDTALLLLFPAELYQEISGFVRELGFTKASFQLDGVPGQRIAENDRAMEEAQASQARAEQAIKALAPEYPKLLVALDYFHTALERERARQSLLRSDTMVLLEGWVPADDSERLRDVLQSVCGDEYFLEEAAVDKDSTAVPIKLKNNRFVSAFESITEMYSVPRYNEVDPTPLLAPFYWLFFGMMVGDMGYGLVILLGTTLALRLLDLKDSMRNSIRFFRFLGIAVMLAGVVYGGAFGVTVFTPIYDATTGAYKAILDSQLDITTMLMISIAIGIVHIAAGLLTKTYMGIRDGDLASGLFDGLFWLIAVLSGIGWLVGGVLGAAALGNVCMWVFVASLVGLAATQGRESPSLGGKIGNGLYGVYGITSYVGDIVSYTRIVALALSGAYIAYAFNLMTQLIVGDFTGPIVLSVIRLIFGVAVVVFGQALNLGLAMLGGYVHSCRLQYVEFFGKFYEGGGRPFRPLTLKNESVHIKK